MTTIFYPLKKTKVSFTFVKAAILSAKLVILTVCSSYAQTAPAPLPKGSSGKGAQDEIRSFQAQPANKKIVLNWTASADRTTSHYIRQYNAVPMANHLMIRLFFLQQKKITTQTVLIIMQTISAL